MAILALSATFLFFSVSFLTPGKESRWVYHIHTGSRIKCGMTPA